MNENNIIFLGMDICKEMKTFTDKLLCKKECDGMNEGQLAAYKMGIKNTLNLLSATIEVEDENCIVVNMNGLDDIQEFDLENLMKELSK